MRAYRIRLGRGGAGAEAALSQGWIGLDWLRHVDLTGQFPEDWRQFNERYRDLVIEQDGVRSRIAAGLACSAMWTVGCGIQTGDLIISPDSVGTFHVGKVTGPYRFVAGESLPHRRPVDWLGQTFTKDDISDAFWRSIRGPFSVVTVDGYVREVTALPEAPAVRRDGDGVEVDDPNAFTFEQHLEDFLVTNWERTELGRTHDILVQDDDLVGRQLQTDTGWADIVAQSKDGKEVLVIELKRGKASDDAVGQILRYMSYLKDLDESKSVRGLIIALEEDPRLRRALAMVPSVTFMRYELQFNLVGS